VERDKKNFGFLDFWFQVCAHLIEKLRWPRGNLVDFFVRAVMLFQLLPECR